MEKEQDLHQEEAPDSINDHAESLETAPTPEMNASPAGEEQKPQNGDAASTVESQTSLAELQERFLRLAADFVNYKRRAEAERAEIADWARRDFALALLPILDDFSLMMEYEAQHPERLAAGARLIRQKTMDLLTRHGLEKIEALNQPYGNEHGRTRLGRQGPYSLSRKFSGIPPI